MIIYDCNIIRFGILLKFIRNHKNNFLSPFLFPSLFPWPWFPWHAPSTSAAEVLSMEEQWGVTAAPAGVPSSLGFLVPVQDPCLGHLLVFTDKLGFKVKHCKRQCRTSSMLFRLEKTRKKGENRAMSPGAIQPVLGREQGKTGVEMGLSPDRRGEISLLVGAN